MIRPGWQLAWRSDDTGIEVHEQRMPGYVRARVSGQPNGPGAVVWAEEDGRVVFIGIDRPAIGARLLELPRGGAEAEDADAVATARRELLEETGLRAGEVALVGTIWPDSGLLADSVAVVRAHDLAAGGVAEFPDLRWLTADEIDSAVASGEIRDGITLSAIALVRARR
ncbi:NUDIX hydrolase [Microbacterium halophytorum]|uniref:NUDIX hydrolase n=1 Tax=Microbacterium halophytorum TaxID=2067568 RepID=UPI000CFCF3AD|nr:NUDIX hydrolase [Microbacterium halophytorum]